MMKKKLSLTLIVFLIDSLYAEGIQSNVQSTNNNDNFSILAHHCGPNEIWSIDEKICELTCNFSTPLLRCLEKGASPCICSETYVRNDLKKCVPFNECSQKTFSTKILSVDTIFNWTQNANLEENQNITLLDDSKIVRGFQEYLSKKLNIFLHSLQRKITINSGRNVRHTDSGNQNVPHDYRYYESRLKESSGAASGLELSL